MTTMVRFGESEFVAALPRQYVARGPQPERGCASKVTPMSDTPDYSPDGPWDVLRPLCQISIGGPKTNTAKRFG